MPIPPPAAHLAVSLWLIDRRYPLEETSEAIRYLEAGHARGKVIITLEENMRHAQAH